MALAAGPTTNINMSDNPPIVGSPESITSSRKKRIILDIQPQKSTMPNKRIHSLREIFLVNIIESKKSTDPVK